MESVTQARRQADRDPKYALIGQTKKVIGNCFYGSCLLNQMKFTNIKYVHGDTDASLCVNSPLFRQLIELGEDFYEVEMAKAVLTVNVPIQLGFFIQNAVTVILRCVHEIFSS